MRALTIWQPWASFLALGYKRIETRSWRQLVMPGEVIAIHAAKRPEPDRLYGPEYKARQAVQNSYGWEAGAKAFPLGAVVALCTFDRIVGVAAPDIAALSRRELALGDFSEGRYGWRVGSLAAMQEPIPCKGAQRLWTLPADVTNEAIQQATLTGFYHDSSGCL